MDDRELIERVRRGDHEAFSRLFARHQRAVFRYAVHMCGHEHGDDVVQETFLALLGQGQRRETPRGPVGVYLLGIARHIVLKRLGARYDAKAREAPIEDVDEVPMTGAGTVLDALTRAETVAAVRAAIDALPPVFREVVVLCELEELDYAEAAAVVGRPIGTVRSRLHRARAQLWAQLSGVAPGAAAVAASRP